MRLDAEVKQYIEDSVLCWLATSSADNLPNVSPKEVFTHYEDAFIIVANIASPQTVRNIRENPKVCVSFIDILVQKGYQLKGEAEIAEPTFAGYTEMEKKLTAITGGKFTFATITRIKIQSAKQILAPSYLLFPDTKEEDQRASAKKRYGFA